VLAISQTKVRGFAAFGHSDDFEKMLRCY